LRVDSGRAAAALFSTGAGRGADKAAAARAASRVVGKS